MFSLRGYATASIIGLLACGGGTDPLEGAPPDSRDMDESPAMRADAGSGSSGGGTKDPGSGPKTPPTQSPVTMAPKKDAGEENCGSESFRTGPVVPDIMIVLDRSGSMRPDQRSAMVRCDNLDMLDPITQITRFAECAAIGIDCSTDRDRNTVNCGGTEVRIVDRWAPSVAAIKKLTSDFNNDVGFGLITFPGQSGGRNDSCTPGSLRVPLDTGKAAEIAGVLDATQPGGGTPTGQALQTALEEFRKLDAADTATAARYVLLVTDGQPTCPNAQGGGGRGNSLEQDKQLTLEALDALQKAGIKTFVIGYDAALDPQFAMSLTEFAQRGGTERYYPVQDEASLADAFKTISSAVIKCEAEISTWFASPRDVHVYLDGNELVMDDPNGWRIDGMKVFVEGDACNTLQQGRGHKIEIVVDCQRLE